MNKFSILSVICMKIKAKVEFTQIEMNKEWNIVFLHENNPFGICYIIAEGLFYIIIFRWLYLIIRFS